jgi:hypothetical protein
MEENGGAGCRAVESTDLRLRGEADQADLLRRVRKKLEVVLWHRKVGYLVL